MTKSILPQLFFSWSSVTVKICMISSQLLPSNPMETSELLFTIMLQVCFEKRLVVAHDLNHPGGDAKRTAYGELGEIHAMLGNYEQAISCMEHQLQDAR